MKLWRGTLLFLVGLALGTVLVAIGPRVAGPYLPAALRGEVESVEGEVTRKLHEPDRLLLTIVTPRGCGLRVEAGCRGGLGPGWASTRRASTTWRASSRWAGEEIER